MLLTKFFYECSASVIITAAFALFFQLCMFVSVSLLEGWVCVSICVCRGVRDMTQTGCVSCLCQNVAQLILRYQLLFSCKCIAGECVCNNYSDCKHVLSGSLNVFVTGRH